MRHGCPRIRPRPRRPPRSRSCASSRHDDPLNDPDHGSKAFRGGLSGWSWVIGCEATRLASVSHPSATDLANAATPRFSRIWPTHFQVDTDLRAAAGNPVCFADALVDTSSSTRILIRCAPSASGEGVVRAAPFVLGGLRRRPHQRGPALWPTHQDLPGRSVVGLAGRTAVGIRGACRPTSVSRVSCCGSGWLTL